MLALLALHGAGVPITEILKNMLMPFEDFRQESDAWKATAAAAASCSAPEVTIGAPERCATESGVVVFTAVSSAVGLSRAIVKAEKRPAGVPCLAVGLTHLAMLPPPEEQHRELSPLSVEPIWISSAACWRPPATWCDSAADKAASPLQVFLQTPGPSGSRGWRHAQVVKAQGLLLMLRAGLHVLVLDLDWEWPPKGISALSHVLRCGVDFAGYSDEMSELTPHELPFPGLNVSLLLVRSTAHSIRLVERLANRSHALSDQLVFNEELSAAVAGECHVALPSESCPRLLQPPLLCRAC